MSPGPSERDFGQLEGTVEAMKEDIRDIKDEQTRIWGKLDDMSETQVKILTEVEQINAHHADEKKRAQNAPTQIYKLKPWEQPIGVLLFNILLQGLKIVGVAVVVAILLYGIGNAEL